MKQEDMKIRNPAAISANNRTSAGPMKDKQLKRVNGENKYLKYLEEADVDLDDNQFDCWD